MTNASKKNNNLLLVPEPVLKRRHDLDELVRKRQASAKATNDKKSVGKKGVYIKKPETILAQARTKLHQHRRYKRVLKKGLQSKAKDALTPTDAKLVIVVRIRSHEGAPKSVTRLLSSMRLRNQYDAVFLPFTDATRKQLQLVAPFCLYGAPTSSTVTDLLTRRGYLKVDGQRLALSDNTVLEDALGQYDILSLQDLSHVLCQGNDGEEAFARALKVLWPFRLSDSKTHVERTTLKLKEGKVHGDQGDKINEYIQQVL